MTPHWYTLVVDALGAHYGVLEGAEVPVPDLVGAIGQRAEAWRTSVPKRDDSGSLAPDRAISARRPGCRRA